MISKTIGFRGTLFSDTPIYGTTPWCVFFRTFKLVGTTLVFNGDVAFGNQLHGQLGNPRTAEGSKSWVPSGELTFCVHQRVNGGSPIKHRDFTKELINKYWVVAKHGGCAKHQKIIRRHSSSNINQ